ncbi:hypothetical protein BCEN4_590028 [Burkholderia cenocepacia]|nr:hypothetical protein BCEN4_590028 [Burkholderia cenocepacia]
MICYVKIGLDFSVLSVAICYSSITALVKRTFPLNFSTRGYHLWITASGSFFHVQILPFAPPHCFVSKLSTGAIVPRNEL